MTLPSSDRTACAILLLLYTIQGIPMGLSASIPFILQQRKNASFSDQGWFTLVSWPFALKVFWAPVVDALYIARVGRRKTWIIPCQIIAGLMFVLAAPFLEDWVSGPHANVVALTAMFFLIYSLLATQDIAVDGWALTMLSKANVELGSTMNSIGQQLGYFIGFVGFLLLCHGPTAAPLRAFWSSSDSQEPIVSTATFFFSFGLAILGVTTAVALFVPETHGCSDPSPGSVSGDSRSSVDKAEMDSIISDNECHTGGISDVYMCTWRMIHLKPIRVLTLTVITSRALFVVVDSILPLKLLDYGADASTLALMSPLMLPVTMATPAIWATIKAKASSNSDFDGIFSPLLYFVARRGSLGVFRAAAFLRIIIACSSIMVVFLFVMKVQGAMLAYIVLTFLYMIVQALQFSTMLEYFASIADHRVGGTYMTFLNTLSNLATTAPRFIAFQMVHYAARLSGVLLQSFAEPIAALPIPDGILSDGYLPVFALFSGLAVLWYVSSRRGFDYLRNTPSSAFVVTSRDGDPEQGAGAIYLSIPLASRTGNQRRTVSSVRRKQRK